jgi:hypothetical protein
MWVNRAICSLFMVAFLGACATAPPARSYPERPFTVEKLETVRVGMTASELTELFGQPDTTYAMQFGTETDRAWNGVAFRYYAERDPRYRWVDRWKKNTFYFYRTDEDLRLNHWVLEHEPQSPTP